MGHKQVNNDEAVATAGISYGRHVGLGPYDQRPPSPSVSSVRQSSADKSSDFGVIMTKSREGVGWRVIRDNSSEWSSGQPRS